MLAQMKNDMRTKDVLTYIKCQLMDVPQLSGMWVAIPFSRARSNVGEVSMHSE